MRGQELILDICLRGQALNIDMGGCCADVANVWCRTKPAVYDRRTRTLDAQRRKPPVAALCDCLIVGARDGPLTERRDSEHAATPMFLSGYCSASAVWAKMRAECPGFC